MSLTRVDSSNDRQLGELEGVVQGAVEKEPALHEYEPDLRAVQKR